MTATRKPSPVVTANCALDGVAEHIVETVERVRRAHERGYCVASVVVGGGGGGAGVVVAGGGGGGVGAGLGFGCGAGLEGAVVVVVAVVVEYDGT